MKMNILRDEIRKTSDGYEILIHLAPEHTEFAKELGRGGTDGRGQELESDVQEYVKRKYPNLKNGVAKVMLGGLLVASVPFGAVGAASAATTTPDMDKVSEWAKPAVQRLVDQKVIVGDENGNFNPQGTMNRDAFVTMLVKSLGLDIVTPATSTFKDVPKESWSFPYVETAVKNGLIAGLTTDTFGPGSSVTREQMAAIYVRALGLTDTELKGYGDKLTFADKDQISDYAKNAVGFAVEQGLLVGVGENNFAAKATATREQVAVLADRFLTNKDKLAGVAASLKAGFTAAIGTDGKVTLTFVNPVENLTADTVKVTDPTGKEVSVKTLNLDTDKKVATLDIPGLAAGTTYTVTVNGKTSAFTTVAATTLAVTGVTTDNLKQVTVNFNTAPDSKKATVADNYTLTDADGNKIALQDATVDGNKVILTVDDAATVDNQTTASLTVGTNILPDEQSFDVTFFDNTIPQVSTASVVGKDTIKVKFSEPVRAVSGAQLADAFKLNGGEVFVKDVQLLNNNTEANVTFYSTFEEGTYKISVNNKLEDFAGFNVTAKDLDVPVVVDTDAPTISDVKNVTATSVTLVFNEDVQSDLSGAELASRFYHTNTSNRATEATIDGKEVTLKFAEANALPNGTAYLFVEEDTLKDLWDNENADQLRFAANVTADTAAPTVLNVKMDEQKTIIVAFDEELAATQDRTNFKLLDKDGAEVKGAIASAVRTANDDGDNNNVTLSLNNAIYGDYTLVVDGVTDTAGNAMDSKEIKFTAADTTAPEFASFTPVLYDTDKNTKTLVVDFDEAMATTGKYAVTDLSNYIVNGTNLAKVTKGVTIAPLDNNHKVKITINTADSGIVFGDTNTMQIARVADAAGNTTSGLSSGDLTVKPGAQAPVGFDTIQAIDTKTLKVTLEDVVTNFNANDFVITANGATVKPASATIATVDNQSVITFKLATAIGYDAANVTVATNKTDGYTVSTQNRFGAKVDFGATQVEDKITPELAELRTDVDDVVAGAGIVTLTFKEAIDPATVSKYSFTVDGFTVNSVSIDPAAPTKLVLNVTPETAGDPTTPEAGTSVSQQQVIYDEHGNALTGLNTQVNTP